VEEGIETMAGERLLEVWLETGGFCRLGGDEGAARARALRLRGGEGSGQGQSGRPGHEKAASTHSTLDARIRHPDLLLPSSNEGRDTSVCRARLPRSLPHAFRSATFTRAGGPRWAVLPPRAPSVQSRDGSHVSPRLAAPRPRRAAPAPRCAPHTRPAEDAGRRRLRRRLVGG